SATSAPVQREPQPADARPAAMDPAPNLSPTSTADTPAAPDQGNQAAPLGSPDSPPEKSRYAKTQERLLRTWEQVNTEKQTLAGDRSRLDQERTELARQRAELESLRQAASPQYLPADYSQAAAAKREWSRQLRQQARQAVAAGQTAEAGRLQAQAEREDRLAGDLADHAETLRKNPPADLAARQTALVKARQQWTLHAAQAYPELAQDGSAFQQAVAGHLQALAKSDPQLLANPSVIYHVARLTAAELGGQAARTAAARVPELVKETENLRAKIKELETLTSPTGDGSVAAPGLTAPADDAAGLRRLAAQQGNQFR
ncbi:MAG TPA: hypothetical protein VF607_13305, partial [Verrucomicrobiae bacterium]